MQIIYKKEDFLFTLFPELKNWDEELIVSTLTNYFTYGPYKPKVRIERELIVIDIDTSTIVSQESDYRKVITLCEKGNYTDAKSILLKIIEKNPTNSEYHRILGQILSDEGDQDEAINCLIDALRWDSKNGWALLMMGNIFAKFKNDVATAMKYYDHALIANPNDNIAVNNIGANLMQQGKIIEAKKYFLEALKINDKYPNTHFALGMIAEIENNLHSAFYNTIQAIKFNKSKDQLYHNSLRQAFDVAKKIIATDEGKIIYRNYRNELKTKGNKDIDIFKDSDISTAAKFEFAENYNREKHTIRFNPIYPAVEHLIMHELVHLDFVINAQNLGLNKLFTSKPEHKTEFVKSIQSTIQKFKKMQVPEVEITNYCNALFDGMNLQVYNAPIDLFIENSLYNEFPELRPYQFISIYNLLAEAIKSVTERKIIEISPKDIISKSKIYNLVNALQFQELFGVDLVNEFKAAQSELKQAKSFYAEYLEYKDDKQPAEEYELVQHWAEDLNLNNNFELIDENLYRNEQFNATDILHIFENIFNKKPDGYGKIDKEAETRQFLENHKENGTNSEVVVFMVEALEYFEGMSAEQIKNIAFEIALQGTNGYHPEKTGYVIQLIPYKIFTGYQILAYYYVSFALAAPEVLVELQLPYHEEYLMAKSIYKRN